MSDEEALSLRGGGRDIGDRLAAVESLVSGLLPDAEIEHVGSTAIPGCLTKGDLDVLVRVAVCAFSEAADTLDAALPRSGRNEPTDDYVEYDHYSEDGHVSVQLVAAGSRHDECFAGFKRALLSDPSLVTRYNEIKQRHEGRPMEEYRAAKEAFIDSVLGAGSEGEREETLEERVRRVTSESIEIIDYDPGWPEAYESERQHLAAYFPEGLVLRVEHVGSTAVAGLGAKPVIDILVGVCDLAVVREQVAPLMEAEGYDYFWSPTHGDDVPPFYAFFIKRDVAGIRSHHIHVVEMDFQEHWDWVLFRDHLRTHPDVAARYEELKRRLAREFARDRVRYTEEKSQFILAALDDARGQGARAASRADGGPSEPAD